MHGSSAGADGTIRFEGNLIKIENMPGPYARRNPLGNRNKRGYGNVFKTRGRDRRVPSFVLRNNSGAFPDWLPEGWEQCFTVINGEEAKERWGRLRQEWIDAHPDIPRL